MNRIHHPVYWLNYVSAFMMPFNGFVDTLVFFYRRTLEVYNIEKFRKGECVRIGEIAHYDSLQDTTSTLRVQGLQNGHLAQAWELISIVILNGGKF